MGEYRFKVVHYDMGPPGSDRDNLDVRRMSAPSGSWCSLCHHNVRCLVVLTKGHHHIWCGICLWCIEKLSEAVEEQ